MPARVELYRTPWCSYCIRAQMLLESKRVPFTEIDVRSDWETRRWLHEVTGRGTVPQIFINGRPVGGFAELAELDRKGALDALLAEPAREPDDGARGARQP